MTDLAYDDAPVFALVDDHIHSAHLFSRMLQASQALAQVKWLGTAEEALPELARMLDRAAGDTPDMIVVDLKSHPSANEDFVGKIAQRAKDAGVLIAAIVADLDPIKRNRLIEAGASKVFERHHEFEAYQREIAEISSFWVRETDTWPILA
jgi:DNA-binding NarL/FixJ family response regulator